MCVFPLTFQFKRSEISPLFSKSLSQFTKMENCFAIPSGGKSFKFIDSSLVMSVEKLHFKKKNLLLQRKYYSMIYLSCEQRIEMLPMILLVELLLENPLVSSMLAMIFLTTSFL